MQELGLLGLRRMWQKVHSVHVVDNARMEKLEFHQGRSDRTVWKVFGIYGECNSLGKSMVSLEVTLEAFKNVVGQ